MTLRRRLRRLVIRLRRHVVVGPMLAGYLAAVVGIPCPLPAVKDTSRPFPCQDHRCGCLCAEQCWGHCCCFSREEHLAWARLHHVEPPAPAAQANGAGEADRPDSHSGGCCSGKGAHRGPANAPPRKASRVSWQLVLHARQCRGEGTLWLSGSPVFPPPLPPSWSYEWVPGDWLRPGHSPSTFLSLAPPRPPPRFDLPFRSAPGAGPIAV